MLNRFTLLLVATVFAVGCRLSARSASGEIAESLSRVTINESTGNKAPIPLGSSLTIVNIFDNFSLGCPTGNRFETIERFNSLRPADISTLLIFSEKGFSAQDIANFKAILPMSESMVQGDTESLRPYLDHGKLLFVLDSNGRLIWQEKANMSEQEVLSELSKLINTRSK